MSKPHRAERLCNSQLFSAGFRVWSTLLSVQQAVGDSQVLGSTRNKQYSSATTVAAIFISGTFSARPPVHLCLAPFHRALVLMWPPQSNSRQERWRGWRKAVPPLLCAGSGAEQSYNTHGVSGSRRDVQEQR